MNYPQPPKWADRFLEWFCRPELLEEIQGDAYELFDIRCQERGIKHARRRFIWDILRSFRLSTIKQTTLSPSTIMLKSHIKIASRHLIRQKFHSFINITGLAVGFAACLLIGVFIKHELSFDQHHEDVEQIYRVISESHWNGKESKGIYHNPPFAETAMEMFPEVENAFRLRYSGIQLLRKEGSNENNYEEGFTYVDQSMFEMLNMPFKYGDPSTALNKPYSIVLSSDKADKYFYNIDPVGKTLFLNNNPDQPYQITGVLKTSKFPSHIRSKVFISMESVEEARSGSWTRSSYPTYIKVAQGTNPDSLAKKLTSIALLHKKELVERRLKAGSPYGYRYKLQPITDIYLNTANVKKYGDYPIGDIRYIWLFGTIAIFILLIAIINFVNLSTAKSANRAKEVGVRKVLGSLRGELVGQFLVESIMLSSLALGLALFIVELSFPFFKELTAKNLIMPWGEIWFVPGLILISLLIGTLAGLYPSFYLSSFIPVKVLKGKLSIGSKSSGLRSTLVVFQFAASIVLIMATGMVFRQMDFIQNKKLGFEKDQVVIIEDAYMLGEQRETFRESIKQIAKVENASLSSFVPVEGYVSSGTTVKIPDTTHGVYEIDMRRWFVDEDYLPTLGMNIIQGRNFSKDFSMDTASIIINETASKMFRFKNPLGQQIDIGRIYTVVGVVEDFHFRSMKESILPLGFHKGNSDRARTMMVKAQTADFESLIADLEMTWHEFAPHQPLRYHFLDEQFESMYTTEQRTGKIFGIFASLAILIACLGLFALSTFMTEQRSKEVSIRKILGASSQQIFQLLTNKFLILIAISMIIAIPLGYLIMKNWLQDFAYQVAISWDIFAISGVIALLIALGSISYQAMRVAVGNPVEALRDE